MLGQINLNTEFGQAIRAIASRPDCTTICEVGAWNGRGSTLCLYDGLRTRPDARLYSLEADPRMFEQARQVWKSTPQVTLLYGTLHRSGMTRADVQSHPRYSRVVDHYNLHYNTEMNVLQSAPQIVLPPCDAILLDGGEFSTEGDWKALRHDGLKVVMLDDTQCIKTNRILAELLNDPAWTCLQNQPNDRNGWAIFERKQ